MTADSRPVWRYSLGSLLVLMVLLNLVLAYVSTVGVWSIVMAIGPPILIAGLLRGVLSEYDRPDQPCREDLRVLGCLVAGFTIWLPVFALLCLRS